MTGVPGAAEVARRIRCGELSAVEHVTQVLAAVDATASVAAWAYVDRDRALAAAERADVAPPEARGPLHGVAVGVKDVIAVAGMPMRAGSRALDGAVDRCDAAAVARLRAAGAILVGKTTTHEFASGQGDPGTRNPHHPDRHPGGSSVGSAVAVSVHAVGATLATDTTGSIRTPSAAQGVVGFKPSNGAVDNGGLLHFSHTLDVIGPIGPRVADCALAFEGLSGRAAASADAVRAPVVAVPTPPPAATPAFAAALERAVRELTAAGIRVVECRPPSYEHSLTAALVLSLAEVLTHHGPRLAARGADYLPETRRLMAEAVLVDADDEAAARRAAVLLREELAVLRAETGADALLGLTLPGPQPLLAATGATSLTAPAEGAEDGALAAALRQLSLANVTGAPAISLPIGLADGHPVGLHLTGLGTDLELLAAAASVERVVCR
ncbi:amidase [Nocardioides ginsengisoli]|uniref:Amidase n=1 Tax=Nocardioides ginsengisoli TaxID=363868 RepID=A0ABW3VVU3_9ACTN